MWCARKEDDADTSQDDDVALERWVRVTAVEIGHPQEFSASDGEKVTTPGSTLKCSGLPILPVPFSPVHSARKFSHVLGAMSVLSSNVMRPTTKPPTVISKKQRGRGDISPVFCCFPFAHSAVSLPAQPGVI